MDTDQQKCMDWVAQGKNIFITGSAGTGKSFTINKLDQQLGEEKTVAITALTGCAAILLSSKARTLHSWAGIGLGKDDVDTLVQKVRRNKKALQRWKTTDILIIDEISMLGSRLFEKLEGVARKIRRKNNKVFGGLQVILVGDFFQLPPVEEEEEFLFESPLFQNTIDAIVELKTIYRQKQDLVWYNILQNIRRGEVSPEDIQVLGKRMIHPDDPVEKMSTLFPVNRKVDYMNDNELSGLQKKIHEFSFRAQNAEEVSPEELDILRNQMGVPEVIKLAVGAEVILTRNLDIENGLVNGAQGTVVGFSLAKKHPLVKFMGLGTPLEIEPIDYSNEKETDVIFFQYPLKLAWALSIHKVQGHNLDRARMDLGSKIFECGQVYVALSRIKTLEGVFLTSFDPEKIRANPRVYEFYKKIGEQT